MAEEGKREKDSSACVSLGSDGLFEFVCQPCSDEDKFLEACGYCRDCEEYLCTDCYEGHRKPRVTRHHVLLDGDTMPKDTGNTAGDRNSADRCTKRCPDHGDEVIKYFCAIHDVVGCIVCVTTRHQGCKAMQYIPAVAKDFSNNDEYTSFRDSVDKIVIQCDSIVHKANGNIVSADEIKQTAKEVLKNLRQDLNDTLNRLEKEIEVSVDSIKWSDETRLKRSLDTCTNVLRKAQQMKTDVDNLKEQKREADLYVAAKLYETEMKNIKDRVKEAEDTNTVTQYKFQPNECLWDVLQKPQILGKIVQQQGQAPNHRNILIEDIVDICVRAESDTDDVIITGSLILGDKVIMWDIDNGKLKIIDKHSKVFVTEKELSFKLWDLTKVSEGMFAATAPIDKQIVLIKTEDKTVNETNKVPVNGQCRGLAYYRGKFAVTFDEPAKLEVIDMDGHVLWKLDSAENREHLFAEPLYVAASPDYHEIVVSDYKKNEIILIDFDGNLVGKYSFKDLLAPTKPAIDENGNIYIGGCDSNNVVLISRNGRNSTTILKQKDGIVKPQALSYCPQSQLLFVGMEKSDVAKVFKLNLL